MIGGRAGGRRDSTVRRQITLFYTVAAVTLVVIGAGSLVASRIVARDQALDEAQRRTVRFAELVVAPLLRPALAGDDASRRRLAETIDFRKADGDLTEVAVWAPDGRVVFSDAPLTDGSDAEPLPVEAAAAIWERTPYAAFEDEPEVTPETTYGANSAGYVEVYVPLELSPGEVYAFEVYYDYGRVNQVANSLLWHILPLVFVPLVLLQVIQVPIAGSLARRVRRQEAERSRLLEQALAVSDKERVRIAADLHDGPIQELAGIGYALGSLVPALPERHRPLADRVGETVLHAVDSLRRMMVDIYPPDLTSGEFSETVDGLATPLREEGLQVDVVDDGLPELDPETITALYRVAREALRNVASHARATAVRIELGTADPAALADAGASAVGGPAGTTAVARLVIADNGIGFAEGDLDRRAEGHLGLRLLQDRVRSLGGVLTVTAPRGGGTRVTAMVPVLVPPAGGDDVDDR